MVGSDFRVTPEQEERAEAAFGHVQHAASEMILAAHDALDLLGDVVSKAGAGFFRRPESGPGADAATPGAGEGESSAAAPFPRSGDVGRPSRVQRIRVR